MTSINYMMIQGTTIDTAIQKFCEVVLLILPGINKLLLVILKIRMRQESGSTATYRVQWSLIDLLQ